MGDPTRLFFLKRLVNCKGASENYWRGGVSLEAQRTGRVPFGLKYVVSGEWITVRVFQRKMRKNPRGAVEGVLRRHPEPGFYWFLGLKQIDNMKNRLAWYYETYWWELLGTKEELLLQMDLSVIQTLLSKPKVIPDNYLMVPGRRERSSVASGSGMQ